MEIQYEGYLLSGGGDLKWPDGSIEKVMYNLILNPSDSQGGGFISDSESSDVRPLSKLLLRVGFDHCLSIIVGRTVTSNNMLLPCHVLGRVDMSVWGRRQEAIS
jgi:hypothetical protein